MKKHFLLLLIALLAGLTGHAIPFFDGTYAEALQKARAEEKRLFINFTASWCAPCKMMQRMVFPHERVSQYAAEHYICLNANIEFPEYARLQRRIDEQQSGVIPHVCIITPDEELVIENGSMTVGQMLRFLKKGVTAAPLRRLTPAAVCSDTTADARLFAYRTPYDKVLAEAKRTNKNMLLYFSSHFCGPCRRMEQTTFSHPNTVRTVNEQFVTGYFEVGDPKDRALSLRYHNTSGNIPYIVIASPDEKIYKQRYGYMDSTAFAAFLRTDRPPTDSISAREFQLQEPTKVAWHRRFVYNQMHHAWRLRFIGGLNITTLRTAGTLADLDFNYHIGYHTGVAIAYERKAWAVTPALLFQSQGARNKEVTLRTNNVTVPVKFTWIYKNNQNGWWNGVSVAPYAAWRVSEKVKTSDATVNAQELATKRYDYGVDFSINRRLMSFDFEAGYRLGLCNIAKNGGAKMQHRGFFLRAALCF